MDKNLVGHPVGLRPFKYQTMHFHSVCEGGETWPGTQRRGLVWQFLDPVGDVKTGWKPRLELVVFECFDLQEAFLFCQSLRFVPLKEFYEMQDEERLLVRFWMGTE